MKKMSNEEAIEVLKGKRECFDTEGLNCWTTNRDCRECEKAIDMAIEALSAKTDGDTISRQDAIEALMNDPDWADAIPTIKSLPSAEPKTGKWKLDLDGMDWNIPAWRCSECGFVASYIGTEANGFGNNPMNWAGSKFCPQCGARITGYER